MRTKTISGIMLALLSISMLILAFNPRASTHASSNPDWLDGWSIRKSHVISSASGAGTNYQIKIKAHFGSGTDSGQDVYLSGHSRADFGDVRFTGDDGTTELDYWLEEKEDADYAIFWVEVADDLSSTEQTIYIYCGKSGETTTSNGDNTFLFFDDFSGASIDSYKWDTAGASGTWSIDSGTLKVTGDGFLELIADSYQCPSTYRINGKWKGSDVSNVMIAIYPRWEDEIDFIYGNYQYETRQYISVREGGSWTTDTFVSISASDNTWYWVEWTEYPSGSYYWTTQLGTNTATDSVSFTGKFGLGRAALNTQSIWFDNIYIHKYVSPEPSHGSWGAEEMPPPTASFVFSPAEPIVAETVTFNASASNDPDGTIVSYAWDFGDGNTTTTANPITTHVYTLSGVYIVTLTVTDNDGLTDTDTKSINVGKLSSTISISAVPTTIAIGENTTISGSITPTRVGADVTIWHRLGMEAWSILATVTTDTNSQYSYDWTPSETGTYEVKTSWPGDSNTLPAESSIITMLVTAPQILSIKLSGEFDYGLEEKVRIKLAALVVDAVTMEPVSNANVTVQIYDEAGSLWISSVMVEKLAGTGIYEWTSSGTIKDLSPDKGVYLVRAQASLEDGSLAQDIMLFHIDPPTGGTNETLYYIALIAIVLATAIGLIFTRQQQIIKRLRRLNRHISNRTTSFLSFCVMDT